MLNKLLINVGKFKPLSSIVSPPKPSSMALPEESMPALKIVHAGGFVESYYMAVPAAKVMEKYPSFLLTKPEVFRRPWDSVVRPDEILTPGEKYFVVPRRTIKKLRQKIQKPNKQVYANSFESKSSEDVEQSETRGASNNRMRHASKKHKHVVFTGIDVMHKVCQMDMSRKTPNPDQSHIHLQICTQFLHQSLTSITESLETNF